MAQQRAVREYAISGLTVGITPAMRRLCMGQHDGGRAARPWAAIFGFQRIILTLQDSNARSHPHRPVPCSG